MPTQRILFSHTATQEKINRSKALRRTMTQSERLMWERLRRHRLGGLHFRRQVVFEPFIVDFYCHALKLVVEIDGEVHDSQKGMDVERDQFLNGLGLRVMRISNQRVLKDIDGVMGEIETVCRERKEADCADPSPNPSPKWGGVEKT